ncbi:hypothetical protein RJ640_017226 [Escallonia rubra]|uniref:Reverse transcriptase Ty1/copia-type domain-containing protein n=1 Tax=Escallonia rubra TaxID=112253 RepID=A0AA88QE58_9ASTE|nr:hypothetical protein RJ640_017226 [Escallonia rubra]
MLIIGPAEVCRAIPDSDNTKMYLAHIEEQFHGSSKAHATTLITKIVTLKYSGSSGIREHALDVKINKSGDIFFVCLSMLTEPHQTQDGPTKILVDNKSALALAKNPMFYERSKHIDTKYHFIRERVSKKEVELEKRGSNNPSMIDEFKQSMVKEFEMTDLGLMAYFLGIEVKQGSNGIFISQTKYAAEILKKFATEDCQPVDVPVEFQPDLLFGVGLVSRYMENPRTSHLQAAKRILKYVKGTSSYGLFYPSSKNLELAGYSDSDWAGSCDDRKTASCVCHAIWLRKLLEELQQKQEDATKIYIDNKSAIALAKNPVHHERSKHIDTRFHFIREHVTEQEVELVHVKTHEQVADIFTKPLKADMFYYLQKKLGVMALEDTSLRRENVDY